MNNQKTIKKKKIIIFYLICFGLICSVTAAYALAQPALNTLEKPEIEYKPSLLTNQAPQTSNNTILPTEGLKSYAYAGPEGYSFIYISASDITLDCNGAHLYSPLGYTDVRGINTYDFNPPQDGYDNVTIKNCQLDSFYVGMYTNNNENLVVVNNIFNGGMDIGFYAKDNNISNFKFNTFEGTWDDYAYYTYFFNVSNSIISDNQKLQGSDTHGMATIFLDGSVDNHIYVLFGNAGIRLTRNSEGNQVYVNQLGNIPDTALERVAISVDRASNYNLIMDNIITDNPNGFGIGLFGHDDGDEISYGGVYLNEIFQNEITDVQVGIYANHDATYNNIYQNIFSNITYNALLMEAYYVNSDSMWYYPHLNTFENNTVTNAFRDVVFTNGVHDNVIKNNTFENSQDTAILLYHYASPSNKIQNNSFENNRILNSQNTGIKFETNASDNNTFTSNQIKNAADRGLYILSGNTNNTFLNNHFISNNTQAYDNGFGNIFDSNNSGNYWDDFDEPLEGCDDSDVDGVCDSLYSISGSAGSVDNFPLTGAPIIGPIADQAINEGQTLQLTVNATDPNDTIVALSASYPGGAFGASFVDNGDNTGTFTWKPWYNQAGIGYEVVFSVSDGIHTDEDTVLIDVSNYIVPPPTITLDASTQTAVAGQAFTLTVSGSSEEALYSVWWGVREPDNYNYDIIPGFVDGVPVNLAPAQGYSTCQGETYCEFTRTVIINEPGNYEIWANSRDTIYFSVLGEPHQASEGLGIPVIGINVAPAFSATPETISASLGSPVNFSISASDDNGDALNLEMVQSVSGATFSASETVFSADGTSTISGNFSWTPNFKHSGSYTVQFQVTDDNGAVTISAPVEILVRNLRAEIIR